MNTMDLRPLAETSAKTPAPAGLARALMLAGLVAGAVLAPAPASATVATTNLPAVSSDPGEAPGEVGVGVEAVESEAPRPGASRDGAWLGISTDEASEALAAQLELPPGAGLVVSHVSSNSPAARLEFQRNDVLVYLDDQLLVHPAQLRKLIQARKEGDSVKLVYYHGGRKQTVSTVLGKAPRSSSRDYFRDVHGNWKDLRNGFQSFANDPALGEQMQALRESLRNLRLDGSLQEEIRGSLGEARKAMQEAIRNSTNLDFSQLRSALDGLARSGALLRSNPAVTVRSTGSKGARSLVQADESGTLVLVGNPKLHLTAHDRSGKLLFDGEIETAEQKDKVPRDLWERVEPLLLKMGADESEKLESEAAH